MTEQEIVQAWKQNDRYFASPNITDEMREWAIAHQEFFQVLIVATNNWRNAIGFSSSLIYRLRPDFELPKEPEFEYLVITKTKDGFYHFHTASGNGYVASLAPSIVGSLAPSIVGFVGYCSAKNGETCQTFEPNHKYVKIRKD